MIDASRLPKSTRDLADDFRVRWRDAHSLDQALGKLVTILNARAAGCWRLLDQQLELVGFGFAADLPAAVSDGFQDATRSVPLDQTGLGIVKAAVSRQPAIGRLDAAVSGLKGSATWIERFAAASSLAVPILAGGEELVGVLAVSTADHVENGDTLWQSLSHLAQTLGESASLQ